MKRLNFLDIIRTFSIFPIVHFHSVEIVFFEDRLLKGLFYEPHYSMYNYSRYFSFSGFTVVFLFYFLVGFKDKPLEELKSKVSLFVIGLVGLSTVCWIAFGTDLFFEWDIYHFLILSFAIFAFLKNKTLPTLNHVAAWTLLSCIPFWYIDYSGPGSDILIGNCVEGTGMWPLFPGLFFICLAYSLGGFVREELLKISSKLTYSLFFLGLAGLALVSLEHFRFTPIGAGFGCFIHRPPAWIWTVTVLSLIALFLGSANKALNSSVFVKGLAGFLSKLAWNKHFGLCYLTQWVFLLCLYLNRSLFTQKPGLFFLAPLAVIALTELTVRLGLGIFAKRSISLK